MAYSTVDKSSSHFETILYTGNATGRTITVGFQPDWVWTKARNASHHGIITDSVTGPGKRLRTSVNNAQDTNGSSVATFVSTGYTLTDNSTINGNSETNVSWNWLAGGTAPAITYVVKVVSDSGNKYRFDDFGTSAVTLDLQEGGTYTFDQSDSSNATHPLRFYTASDKTGGEYTTGVTTTGTPGSSGAKTVITVAASAPTLYYQCSSHSGMGGQANTNSTHGSSNFSGGIQSTVSVNTTTGFSIVSYTGTDVAGATVGHGLGAVPKWILLKRLVDNGYDWVVYHANDTAGLYLNSTGVNNDSSSNNIWFNGTAPTSSVFSIGTDGRIGDATSFVAYCFAETKGFSKFGTYTGNGNTNGPFNYCGFKPTLVIFKKVNDVGDWQMTDNERVGFNPDNHYVQANSSGQEQTTNIIDLLSNGFKIRGDNSNGWNKDGSTYIYMAWGQTVVGSNNVPTTAR